MAIAQRVTYTPRPDTIMLTLSLLEARALKQVCDSIGGNPNRSARTYFDSINDALITAQVKSADHKMIQSEAVLFFLDQERSTL